MRNYYVSLVLFFLPSMVMYSQIGINTETPDAALDVLSVTSVSTGKILVAANSDNNQTLQIRNDGYIGVGATNPLVKLDLRANNLLKENAIGIGYTNMAAAAAGAGAIRYEPTSKTLQYSDGTTWLTLQDNPAKAMVIAQNSSGLVFPNSGGIISGIITNWTSILDQTGSFNATSGFFTAPRTGVYSVTVTAVFPNMPVVAGGQYELNLSGGGVGSKSVVPLFTEASSVSLTNLNKSLYFLTAGQQLRASVYIYLPTITINPALSADPSLNVLTIAEM